MGRALADPTGRPARTMQVPSGCEWGKRLCVTLSLLSHAGCARLGRPDPTGQPSVGQAEESSLGKG